DDGETIDGVLETETFGREVWNELIIDGHLVAAQYEPPDYDDNELAMTDVDLH
ncbi:unnamed protein product, partial [Didymodactylos carnosus]